jgi:hypothetical protein
LTIRTTQAHKAELLRAAKAAGRSLAEEIEFRLGATRTHRSTGGDFEQIFAMLDQIMDWVVDAETTLTEVVGFVYHTILALQEATGSDGTKLMWDEGEEKFVPRPPKGWIWDFGKDKYVPGPAGRRPNVPPNAEPGPDAAANPENSATARPKRRRSAAR